MGLESSASYCHCLIAHLCNNPVLVYSQVFPISFNGHTAPKCCPSSLLLLHVPPQSGLVPAFEQLAAKEIQWRNTVQQSTATISTTQGGHLRMPGIKRKGVEKAFSDLNNSPAFPPMLIFPSQYPAQHFTFFLKYKPEPLSIFCCFRLVVHRQKSWSGLSEGY